MARAHAVLLLVFLSAGLAACSAEGEVPGFRDTGPVDTSTGGGEDTGIVEDDVVTPDFDATREDAGEPPDVVMVEDVISVVDGTGVYDVPPAGDACPFGGDDCRPRENGCIDREICDDGLDNNCNGQVDELCTCLPGTVQRCFLGPPGRRGVGVCQDGMQTCQGIEIGQWGPCEGGISPRSESCNMADDDCDGCVDNGLCCRPLGTCPSGDDPRVPTGRPFQQYRLNGADFYPGGGHAWSWTVEGGPCDQLLFATSRRVSYTLMGATAGDPRVTNTPSLVFTPTLSGDYTVRLRVMPSGGGEPFECTFLIKVRAPGFRAELCWNRTGETDVDLWVHDPRNQGPWRDPGTNSCMYLNCRNGQALNWGYSATTDGSCREPMSGRCNNPRLDVDNISDRGVPENINVDVPRNNDTFRVGVNYYGGTNEVLPMVNIYCGGALRATYGGAMVDGRLYGSSPITGFNRSGANTSGSFWRVVDVTMSEPSDTCELVPLVPNSATSGSCVQTGTDRTYNGNCRRRP